MPLFIIVIEALWMQTMFTTQIAWEGFFYKKIALKSHSYVRTFYPRPKLKQKIWIDSFRAQASTFQNTQTTAIALHSLYLFLSLDGCLLDFQVLQYIETETKPDR